MDISILDRVDYQNYPEADRPLFKGRSYDNLSFSVTIPESGNYFLVLDNKDQENSVDLQLQIHAETAVSGDRETDTQAQLQNNLGRISTELNKLFVFDPFPINLQGCGKEGAFSGKGGVVLCTEFVEKIQKSLQDKQKATDVLLFTIFHEIGHVLLYQWDYPFYDNEELADEFATALLLMLRQQDRLTAVTEFFISNPSAQELMAKAFQNDRHPLSIQRARNILEWMKDRSRIGRWQMFLIPHMQTDTLRTLRNDARSVRFQQAIDRELTLRN
ncbi:MAG: DUF4344 domain-containing metallopeptidase [Desulfuromonadales bacterium]|nr:DUF4344 domain-containing metallopeptidase [Desulfuromonadales bacterium]